MFLPVPNPKFYPSEISAYSAHFDEKIINAETGPEWFSFAARLSTKRLAEFMAGRLCVQKALAQSGYIDHGYMLQNDYDRSPIWPSGFTGSLTHTEGFVSAAVALKLNIRSIGIDSEKILTPAVTSEIKDIVCSQNELETVALLGNLEQRLSLIYSFKESIYKCLFPLIKKFFDFSDVEIISLDMSEGELIARIVRPLSAEFVPGVKLKGNFDLLDPYVHTALILPSVQNSL